MKIDKNLSASGVLCPLTPSIRGCAPGPRWGSAPRSPFRLMLHALAMVRPPLRTLALVHPPLAKPGSATVCVAYYLHQGALRFFVFVVYVHLLPCWSRMS